MSAAHAEVSGLFDQRLGHLFLLRTPLLKTLRAAGDTHTVGDIADHILSGRFQYWAGDGAGIVTEVLEYPRKKVLNYFLGFGALDACLALQPQIEAFAYANGCRVVICAGRHGWEKILPAHGWRKMWSVMAKEIAP